MLSKIILFFVFILSCTSLKAQDWIELSGSNTFSHAAGLVYYITSDVHNNIYAVGSITNASGKYHAVKWDGNNWNGIGGSGFSNNPSYIYVDANETAYLAGSFYTEDYDYYMPRCTKDGSWNNFALVQSPGVILSDLNGNILTSFNSTPSGGGGIVKWNGSSWDEIGTGANALHANNYISAVHRDASGNLYAAGYFTNASDKIYVAKWNGSSWSELGIGVNAFNINGFSTEYIGAIKSDALGNIYVVGSFLNSDRKYYVAKWNGTTWSEVGTGANALNANSSINAIAFDKLGNLYAAGSFKDEGSKYYVAKWDGTTWTKAGGPLDNFNGSITTLCTDENNNVYAAGYFKNTNGYPYVAKYQFVTTSNQHESELDNSTAIKLYPNPTHDQLSIVTQLSGEVIIYDAIGGVVLSATVMQGSSSINIDHLKGGFYTVVFKDQNKKSSVTKLIKSD